MLYQILPCLIIYKSQIELEKGENVDTINEDAEEIEVANNANIKTKYELLQQMIDKDVIKNEMINVAGQMFIEYERERDEPHQKKIENFTVDVKKKYCFE